MTENCIFVWFYFTGVLPDSYTGAEARKQLPPGLLANDSDPDGDSLQIGYGTLAPKIVTGPTNGSVSMPFQDGSFYYTPNVGYTGDDSFVYNVCDSLGACTETSVTLIQSNSAPIGGADSYTGVEARKQLPPGLLANDSDPDGDPLQIGNGTLAPKIVTGPTNGSVSMPFQDGSFSYTPNVGYTGDDSFVYNSCDSLGGCTETSVTLIKPNSAPIGGADSYTGVEARKQPGPGLLANDSDPDGDPLQIGNGALAPKIVTGPTNGSVSMPFQDGSFYYTPSVGYTGDDSFVYNSCDSLGGCTETNVTLIKPNSAPIGGADSYSITQGETLSVTGSGSDPLLLANDSDPDEDAMQVDFGGIGGVGIVDKLAVA